MQVRRQDQSDTEVKLTITADEPLLQRVKTAVLQHMNTRHVKLPGFREGKAPLSLVEKHVDQQQLQQEFLEEAVNRMYVAAIKDEGLRPVVNPDVKLLKFVPFTELEFEATFEALSNISLPDYTKIRKVKPTIKITADDVSEVVKALRQRVAEKKDVDRAGKNGDQVIIDFRGTDTQGQPVAGADGKDYPLILGSNTFIPGFEPEVVGLQPGETKSFTIAFPKDYGVKALQGKKVTFQVTIHTVQEIIEPKLDDAFAAQVGPFKTVAELKDDIKKQLTAERQQETDRQYENELVDEIAQKAKVTVPKTLVDEQIMRAEQEERQNLTYRGQTWQEHLEAEGVSEEEHRERNRPTAEAQVKAGLVLSEIADKEGIAVSPEEVEVRLQILKGQYEDPQMRAELDKPENKGNIESRIRTEKTLAKLVEYASGKR